MMIPVNGFHIEPTNICTLKCPGCARTQFLERWPRNWKNHNLDIDDLMRFLDIDIAGLNIRFCGNYGDPIYHPNFIEMVSAVKKRGAVVSIDTNGSYRKSSWWQELCDQLDAGDRIRFGIDGVPENFTKYRINADWTSIQEGISVCVKNHIKTIWKFIPFSFNQDDIQQASQLSQQLGMTEFFLHPSDRYDDTTQHLIPTQSLIGPKWKLLQNTTSESMLAVSAKCKSGSEHFITAQGHYSPCCFVADHRFYFKTQFGQKQSNYNIKTHSFSQIMISDEVKQFMTGINEHPHPACQFNCPKPIDQ